MRRESNCLWRCSASLSIASIVLPSLSAAALRGLIVFKEAPNVSFGATASARLNEAEIVDELPTGRLAAALCP